jgi:hypothetical protein
MMKAPDWFPAVAAGDFSALPTPLLWAETADFALLVDGYGLAGSHEKAAIVFRDVLGELRRTGTSTASARALWVALFFSWRRLRFVMGDQTDEDVALLDRLCDLLRQRLQDLTPSERTEIRAAMEASPWKGRR